MRSTAKKTLLAGLTVALALTAVTLGTASAGLRLETVYSSGPVDVRVWLDRGYEDYYDGGFDGTCEYYDVYPSADDVVLFVRPVRSCYTTVYVIDTEGFVHVISPLSPFDEAYLIGGRVYRFHLRDYGFHSGCFRRGVAFAFAVTSPVPFGYADYGVAVFGPHVGVQIYGDPFVAARLFYLSLLPRACNRGLVTVSYTRFYVREYVRYPSYLCLGWRDHYNAPYCGGECGAHRQYRVHAKDPYRVLRPSADAERESARYTQINRTGAKDFADVRVRTSIAPTEPSQPITRDKGPAAERRMKVSDGGTTTVSRERVVAKDGATPVERKVLSRKTKDNVARSVDSARRSPVVRSSESQGPGQVARVVRSTKEAFVAGKRNYAKMREVYEKSGAVRPDGRTTSARVTENKVTDRASKEAKKTAAPGSSASSKNKSGSGKSAKRSK